MVFLCFRNYKKDAVELALEPFPIYPDLPNPLHLGHEGAIPKNLLREIQVKYPLTRLKSR